MKYVIDATNKKLGRVATEAATVLMGKNTPAFAKNVVPEVKVSIENASKLSFDEKKLKDKHYKRFSGHPGGLKEESMRHLMARKGVGEIVRIAVKGMLPKNKLQAQMIKNLIVTE